MAVFLSLPQHQSLSGEGAGRREPGAQTQLLCWVCCGCPRSTTASQASLWNWFHWKYSGFTVFCSFPLYSKASQFHIVVVRSLSHIWLLVTPWTVAHQASLSVNYNLLMFFFIFFSIMVHHRVLNLVSSALQRTLLLIQTTSPNFTFPVRPPPSPLASISLTFVSAALFHRHVHCTCCRFHISVMSYGIWLSLSDFT